MKKWRNSGSLDNGMKRPWKNWVMFIIAHLINNVCFIEQDPDDNKFVDSAIVAGADYSRIKIARNNQLFDSQWGFHCDVC